MRKRIKFITSFFYLGHSPYMPGTMGSLGGLFLYFLVRNNDLLFAFMIFFLFALGMMFAGEAEKVYRHKDARMIVIDEACGMLLSLFLLPKTIFYAVMGFFLFRLFDVLKPYPARKLEKLSGAAGVMYDDIVAALYTNVILQIIAISMRQIYCR